MSIQSVIPKKADESEGRVAQFLAPKKSNEKLEVFRSIQADIGNAFEEPDTRRVNGRSEPNRPQRDEPEGQGAPPAGTGNRQLAQEDEISVQTTAKAVPNKNMVEKTFSIDKGQYKKLVRFSNLEGLRLEANVATSQILRHLLEFALAHVDHEKGEILPSADGRGLRIPDRRQPR